MAAFSANLMAADFHVQAAQPMLQVIKRQENGIIRFFIQNMAVANITATFDLSCVNLKASKPLPFTTTFAPQQMVEAFSLIPVKEDVQWKYTLTNHYTVGSNQAVHDARCIYQLPYAKGQAFTVSQAHDGAFSHHGAERFAIDWRMPEGTPIHAAREGVVVDTKSDSNEGGVSKKYKNLANYILIQHADGTIANYAHLQYQGVKAQIGQKVQAGQMIGLSGNTGFSNGPHLHFCVFKTKNGQERESVPVKFNTHQGFATLLSGVTYRTPTVFLATTYTHQR